MADWPQVSTAATDRAVTLMPQSVSERVSCRCRRLPRGTDFALGILGGAPHQSLDQRGMACNYSPPVRPAQSTRTRVRLASSNHRSVKALLLEAPR
jgi:hypothetical protein